MPALAKSWILEKGFPARADLILESARNRTEASRMSMVDVPSNGYHCHQGTSMRCELCEELHCSDPTVFETDLESVPLTEYEEELLAKRKFCNMGQLL